MSTPDAPRRSGILFLNPRAGSFDADDESALRALADENGLRIVEVHPEIDMCAVIGESLAAGIRTFIVGGGDGSVHHAAQALVNTEGILGILPIGTLNHLARDLSLPVGDWRAAFDVALRGEIRQIDVGRVNGRYFLNSVMLGIYPTISAYRERFRSLHSRWRSYFKAVRLALRQFPHVTVIVEHDGQVETLRTQMFTVAVNSYDLTQGGVMVPKTNFNDGRLTIYSLSFMSRWQFVRAAAKYLRGRITDVPGFRRVRTKKLRVSTSRGHLRVAVDGEIVPMQTPLQIAAVPSSLLVRVPGE